MTEDGGLITDGGRLTDFSYYPDGQLASRSALQPDNEVTADERGLTQVENFYWDNLALIKRDEVDYTIEPHVNGGSPILTTENTDHTEVLFNDILGSSLGAVDTQSSTFDSFDRTSFGQTDNCPLISDDFYTGKPNIEGLGYTFLFRNYRPDLGKWTTSDPLGYPDGWNNLAYCNNWVMFALDPLGAVITTDAKGIDIFNPQWAQDWNTVRDYLGTSPLARTIIDEMEAADNVIEINQDDRWPTTESYTVGGDADIYIDNDVSFSKEGRNYSFSEALLWELCNAYARTILEGTVNEQDYTNSVYWEMRNELDASQDPFPFDPNNVWLHGDPRPE